MAMDLTQFTAYLKFALILPAVLTTGQVSDYKRVCSYRGWSGRGDARFSPEDIDSTQCSHLIYSYANLERNRIQPEQSDTDMYRRINNLKLQNPNLKTLISVGGWNLAPSKFTSMVSTSRTRRVFIQSVLNFLVEHDFDGIDLHFTHARSRDSSILDKYRFSKLCQEMRVSMALKKKKYGLSYLLVVTGPAEEEYVHRGFDVRTISRYAHFINLMTLDFHGSWEEVTGHQAALFAGKNEDAADSKLNVEWAANYWHSLGAPKEKLVIGMPFYGRGFTLAKYTNSVIGSQTTAPSVAGAFTREGGFLAFFEICQLLQGGATRHWLTGQQVPYLTLGSQWVGYDDRASLTQKVKWLKNNGYGGWMAWSLEYDDFSGKFCQVGEFPLLHAMNDALSETTRTSTPPRPEDLKVKSTTESPEEDNSISESFCKNHVDGHYAHPTDCTRYIECVWETMTIKTCPPGLIYNREVRHCDTAFGFFGC